MHVGCAHSRFLRPHYRQTVHEAARHLPPGDKALWEASWRSAGAAWTGVFCSGLVPEETEAQLRAIARYDPPGGTSVDDFLHHMLRLGDFTCELRNHRLEQLLREPLSAAARVHRWLTAAEGNCPLPPPRPGKDFVASLRVVNGTLRCSPQEDPNPYRDLPRGFSRHLQDALFPPWIIGRGSMTAWEARIVGHERAREWGRWCAATRAPETPAKRYAAIPLEGWGPHTQPRPTMIRGAGPDHLWDAATKKWLQAAPGPQTGWTGDLSSLVRAPVPPLHRPSRRERAPGYGDTHMGTRHGHHLMAPPGGRGHPAHSGALQNRWGRYTTTPCPGWATQVGPYSLCSPPALQLRSAISWTAATSSEWSGRQSRTATYWPSSTRRRGRVPMGYARAPPHRAPRVYGNPPPQGHPRPAWDDLIAAFHDHGILPDDTWREVQRKTLGRDYRRRVRARLLEIRDALRQRWDDLWLRRLRPWSPPSHLPHICRLCGECDTVSSAAPTGANRCVQCSQVAGCPWPEPPAGPHRRTEEEALHRRIEGAHVPSHERAGPTGAALLWIHVHLREPTSVAHLAHVFAP